MRRDLDRHVQVAGPCRRACRRARARRSGAACHPRCRAERRPAPASLRTDAPVRRADGAALRAAAGRCRRTPRRLREHHVPAGPAHVCRSPWQCATPRLRRSSRDRLPRQPAQRPAASPRPGARRRASASSKRDRERRVQIGARLPAGRGPPAGPGATPRRTARANVAACAAVRATREIEPGELERTAIAAAARCRPARRVVAAAGAPDRPASRTLR